jgi:putative Holliday junction resolvase
VNEILERARELEADGFVVGLPLNEDGEENDRTDEARRVATLLGARSGLPVRLVDERFTTAAAQRAIREMGGSTRGRKGDVDALAAAVLLQHALQLPEPTPP